jgi:CheY-like chemotaxis protein
VTNALSDGRVAEPGDLGSDLTPPTGRGTGDLAGTTFLVVDDDYRNTFALTAFLERADGEVMVAENGPDAVALLEHTSDIDIVLMDIMMPLMDGYETMRAIRALDHVKTLPIIAVTGKVMPGERQRCLDAGASDYIPKPVDTEALVALLRPWLATSGASRP